MNTFTASQIMALTGIANRVTLMAYRDDLGIPGKTATGAARPFSIVEALLIALAAELTNQHGLRRTEAIAIAQASLRDLGRLLVNEDDLEHWLLAHRLTGDVDWTVTVTHAKAAHDILFGEGRHGGGHIVVDLAGIVRRVTEAAAGHG